MADPSYQPKVYRKQGGAEMVIASGGKITVESGGTIDPGPVAASNTQGGCWRFSIFWPTSRRRG
jgi:hypothetical protein